MKRKDAAVGRASLYEDSKITPLVYNASLYAVTVLLNCRRNRVDLLNIFQRPHIHGV